MLYRLVTEQLKPVSGLYKVKKWIEDNGLKRAAVTNAPRPNAELMISMLGLSDFFEAIIIGDECEYAKPHPDPYLRALELLKVSKDHTFIFEVCLPLDCTLFARVSDHHISNLTSRLLCVVRILYRGSKLEWQPGCLLSVYLREIPSTCWCKQSPPSS